MEGEKMKVIIPVAGAGTRLRPHTYSTPKPLLYVAGKAVIAHVLKPILELDPEEIIFVVGFMGDQIEKYIKSNFSFKARFVYQNELLGLGYAVDLGLQEIDGGPVMVVLGDTIVKCDLKQFIQSGDFALGLMPVDDPWRFGIAEINNGILTAVEEKPENPKSNLAIIGLYYFKDSLMLKGALQRYITSGKYTRGEIQLTDALELMIREKVRFVPFEVQAWLDCGKKNTLLDTNRRLLAEAGNNPVIKGSVIVPPVYIYSSVKITNSVVGPYVSIAKDTEIENCIIKNSIIGENSQIRDMVFDDSLIGNFVNIKGDRRSLNIGSSSEVDFT